MKDLKMIGVMSLVGTLSAVAIVLTFHFTLPVIQENRARFLEQAVYQVLPGAVSIQKISLTKSKNDPALQKDAAPPVEVHAGYNENNDLIGVALEGKGQGFQDVIHILYGYNPQCECIIGYQVLDSRETPGLGDKIITDPDFLSHFKKLDVRLNKSGTDLLQPVTAVKKGTPKAHQIDAISGATISSQAVARIITKSAGQLLPLIHNHPESLRAKAEPFAGSPDEGDEK